MPATKIKKDSHGLYVRTNGSVYRPQVSKYSYPVEGASNGASSFDEGTPVTVNKHSQSPHATVRLGYIDEVWHSHGSYLRRKTDDCWSPK